MTNQVEQLMVIPFDNLKIDDSLNNRTKFNAAQLSSLAEDIRANGLLTPVLARYRHEDETFPEEYVLVAGFCRSHSCRDILKLTEINAVVKPLSKLECIIANASENLKRTDLNKMEEAEPIRRLSRMGMNRDEIAKVLGKPSGWVQPLLYLLRLEPGIQEMAKAGFLTNENIRDLYSMQNATDRMLAAKRIKELKQASATRKVKVFSETKETKRDKARLARHRTKGEIENLLEWLDSIEFPFGIQTRFLGWAAGNVSDLELQAHIQTFYAEIGKEGFYPVITGIPLMKEERAAT